MSVFRVTTGPTAEPVSLSFVKNWLKMDDIAVDDELIVLLMAAARERVEQLSGRALMPQTIEEYFDEWPTCGYLSLCRAPVQSITSIQYRDDTDGTYQTWVASNYEPDLIGAPCRVLIDPDGELPDTGNYPNRYKITYVAGYTSADVVPATLKKAMAAQVCADYCERQGYDMEHAKFLNSIDAAIRQYKTALI